MWTEQEIKIIKDYVSATTQLKINSRDFKKKMSETAIRVKDLIERYGDDGFGNKPKDMNRVLYWISHLD